MTLHIHSEHTTELQAAIPVSSFPHRQYLRTKPREKCKAQCLYALANIVFLLLLVKQPKERSQAAAHGSNL